METQPVVVPDFLGQFVHIARDQAKRLGLDLAGDDPDGVPITSKTWPGLYCVTGQDPAPGAVAHRGDLVRVSFVEEGQARGDVLASPPPLPPSLLTMAIKIVRATAADGRHIDVDQAMAMIEKSQQLAGHFPNAEALDRARRVLEGEITAAEGYAELDAKYSR